MANLINTLRRLARKDKQPRPILTEVATSQASKFLQAFSNYKDNPDEILRYESSGRNYDKYIEVLKKDPTVYSCVDLRTRTVSTKSWEVVPFDESDAAQEEAEFVSAMLDAIVDFSGVLQRCLGAIYYGFSVQEILWELAADGSVHIRDIVNRHNNRFKFGLKNELLYAKDEFTGTYSPVPPRKFIVLSSNTVGENPYGAPLAQIIYWYWWFKKEAMKNWTIASEKFGMPTVHATHDGTLNDDEQDKLEEAIKTLMIDTSFVSARGIDIKLLEAMRQSGAPFEGLIARCNEEIAKAILGQTLTSQVGDKGSQALGRIHENVREDIIQSDAEMLMGLMNSTVVQWLIDFNFPPTAELGYPTFLLKYEPEKDLNSIVNRVSQLVPLGMPIPLSWLREQLTLPEPEEGEPVLEAQKQPVLIPGEPDETDEDTEAVSAARVLTYSGVPAISFTRDAVAHTSHFSREDPEKWLPGLPPLPEPVAGRPMPKQPAKNVKLHQIGAIGTHQSRVAAELHKVYGSFTRELIREFGQDPDRLFDVIDDFVAQRFTKRLTEPFIIANRETIRQVARQTATTLGTRFDRKLFEQLTQDYLKRHAYDKGVIADVGETMKTLLSERISDVINSGVSIEEMMADLTGQLGQLSAYKIEQIVVTETRQAANWAVLEMGERSKLKLDAWFIVDPESCEICLDLASRNPHKISEAKENLLPHVQCNDYWTLAAKEK